jgi:hypothetical protein
MAAGDSLGAGRGRLGEGDAQGAFEAARRQSLLYGVRKGIERRADDAI